MSQSKNFLANSFRAQLNEAIWRTLLFSIVGALIAGRYLTGLPDVQWWQSLYVFCAATGVFWLGHFVLQAVLVLPLYRLNISAGRIAAFLLTFILLVALVADTVVYQQYRFHINWPMIDLALVGGRDVFSFSTEMWLKIAFLVCCVAAVSVALVWVSRQLQHKMTILWACLFVFFGYVVVNLINAYSVSQNVKAVTVLTERIPLYYPLRANSLLHKFGLVAVREEKVNLTGDSGSFLYPLNALTYGNGTGQNVLILAIDSLRADVVDEKTMPNLSRFRKRAISFVDHYSGGNATRAGVFSLFYGLPPLYWQTALSTNVPAAMVSGFQKAGYEVTAFTTATLLRPEFYATVFAGVPELRMGSTKGKDVCERDVESVDDFENWLGKLDSSKKFLSFMFLDSAHAVSFPDELEIPYKDYWKTVDRLELSPEFDPAPFFNRYKNSVYWQDVLIGRVIDILEKSGRLENTIVIITADHGEEFNDSKLNYWGHNGNFSKAQIQIPLVVYWPGMKSEEISYRTTAYDISATLMKRVLNVQNPVEDFSVGKDLFVEQKQEVFFVGSYNEDAIVAGDEVLLIKMSGAMQGYRLKDWQETDTNKLKRWVPQYLQMRGKYRQ